MIRPFGWSEVLLLVEALRWTALLSVVAMLFGGLLGLFVALARVGTGRTLRAAAAAYITAVQGIPVLILLFLGYFGVSAIGLEVPPFVAASLSLSVFASGYLGDIWRGAIESVPVQQWEASASLALTRAQQYWYVIIPQAVRIALPPTVGFLVQLIKNTSIVSIVSVVEVTRAGQLVNNATFEPFPVFLTVAGLYFVICYPLSLVARRLEMKLDAYRAG